MPVATNTGHWKKHVFTNATGICFLYDTRLKFLVNGEDGGKGAPMSCAMIYWGHESKGSMRYLRNMARSSISAPYSVNNLESILENGRLDYGQRPVIHQVDTSMFKKIAVEPASVQESLF